MNTQKEKEIKEIIQSSHLNFLVGAGLSSPFLPILGNIETRLSSTINKIERNKIKKEYLQEVILPNLDVINNKIDTLRQSDYQKTYNSYRKFFELIGHILLRRKNTILSKQVNIFTTNIDILMETVLEDSSFEYNDGFAGRLSPVFSLSNFKKTVLKRSLHFENISEIPLFNLAKIHGSLTWNKIKDKIFFSKLEHFNKSLINKRGKSFENGYKKIAIINPEKKKLEETVIDLTHYELLRMYSSELEKENVVLFVMGFSMEDEHIREITIRTADSNPTLKIFIFCYSKENVAEMINKMHIGKLRYSNIEIIEPDDKETVNKLNLEKINETVFSVILNNMMHDCKE